MSAWSCLRQIDDLLSFESISTIAGLTAYDGARLKTFKKALRQKDFAVTASVALLPETDSNAIRGHAECLRDWVDAVLLTDNQFGQMHMSTVASASLLLQNQVDPIMQVSCRNKNQVALLGDLLGAAALGVSSLLLVPGKKVPAEIERRPKAVMDVSVTELITMASQVKTEVGDGESSEFLIGSSITPHYPGRNWTPRKLIRRIETGVRYVQMPICMDATLLREYMKILVAADVVHRVSFIAGVAIFPDAEAARWLSEHRTNVRVPDELIKRIEQAKNPEQTGIDICAEALQEFSEIPGIAGASITPGRELEAVPASIRAAGLVP